MDSYGCDCDTGQDSHRDDDQNGRWLVFEWLQMAPNFPRPYLLHADNTGFSEEATAKEAVRHSKGSLNIPHKGSANTSVVHKASHNIINRPLRRKCFVALFSVLCIEKNIVVLYISSLRYSGDMEWYY